MKISKSQVLQIIQEEAQKVKQEIILRRELSSIEKELNELNEVHAGGPMAPGKDGVHDGQKKAVFTKKGSHLIEDEDAENDETSADDVTSDVEDMDMDSDASGDMEGEIEMDAVGPDLDSSEDMGSISIDDVRAAVEKLGADLGLTGQVDFDAAAAEESGLDDVDAGGDIGVDIETGAEDAVDANLEPEVDVEAGAEEMGSDESGEENGEESIEECGDTMPAENDNMAENKKMNEEVARWKRLAGIVKG